MEDRQEQHMTDAEIRAIVNSESDDKFWARMYFEDIAQQISNEDDEEWRTRRCSE